MNNCPRCSALRKELGEVRLPEGAVVTYNGVSARVAENSRLDPSTLRKAASGGAMGGALAMLAAERTPSGSLPVGGSKPVVLR